MRGFRFVTGMLVGALVGVGLVLLFAPQSGAATRQAIQDHVQSVVEEGRQAAETRRLELTAQFEALKQPNPPRQTPE
jgi:gas vesicle protein